MFYDDPNVLYFSIHRYDNGQFYPGSYAANHTHVGEGLAKGKNINVPWPSHGFGNDDYIYVFNKLLMPVAFEFDPDIVLGKENLMESILSALHLLALPFLVVKG